MVTLSILAQLDIVATEGVRHRVGDGGRREHGAAVAHALGAQRVHRRRRNNMADHHLRHLGGGRTEIVGKGSGQELSLLIVGELFHQRGTEAVREAAVDLALDDERIELRADVVDGHIFVDLDRPGILINLDRCEVDDKAEGRR